MTIEFDFNDSQNYKKFYEIVSKKLNLNEDKDLSKFANLNYNADLLYEFLTNIENTDINFIFYNVDRNLFRGSKNYNYYEWNLIFSVLENFCKSSKGCKIEYK